jgi:hypothetical protein
MKYNKEDWREGLELERGGERRGHYFRVLGLLC